MPFPTSFSLLASGKSVPKKIRQKQDRLAAEAEQTGQPGTRQPDSRGNEDETNRAAFVAERF